MKHQENHILPLKTYLMVGAALFVLTAITVAVSFVHFGPFNLVIAMAIATVKGLLVALFFMHLLYDNKFFLTVFVLSIVFVSVFIILTMFDTMRRADINAIKANPIQQEARMYDKKQSAPPADSTQGH